MYPLRMRAEEEKPFKVGIHRRHEGIVEYRYGHTFEKQSPDTIPRLLVAPSQGQIRILREMLQQMPENLSLMYVLLAPQTRHLAGRYISGPLQRSEVDGILLAFGEFFEGDARHNLWIISNDGSAMLVYDQHNVIYAYGPLEAFREVLERHGLAESETEFPYPHTHHFRSGFDGFEDRLLSEFDWTRSDLLPEDEA
jgi:hypothetical protein